MSITEALRAAFADEPKVLWEGYGIISDITVSFVIWFIIALSLIIMKAIYCPLPSC